MVNVPASNAKLMQTFENAELLSLDTSHELIPPRTNFSKVILKTYSNEFNLSRERKKTEDMVNLSRQSRERINGKFI